MKMPEPTKEHLWLKQFAGDWETEVVSGEFHSTGTDHVRMIGDLWIVGEGRGEMPGGGTALSMLTLGYDPEKGRFVGTWIGSMMTHMWVYEGRLEGNVLVLDTEGPDMQTPGQTLKYEERIELVDANHRIWTSYTPGEGGANQCFMTMRMTRKT